MAGPALGGRGAAIAIALCSYVNVLRVGRRGGEYGRIWFRRKWPVCHNGDMYCPQRVRSTCGTAEGVAVVNVSDAWILRLQSGRAG